MTGGGSGIGAALAGALHARGTKVIVAGRTAEKLEAVAAQHPRMEAEIVDVADPQQVYALAERVAARHPGLDAVINNAGVQTLFDFTAANPADAALIDREIAVNLSGLIHVSNAFLPLLKRQASASLVHVGSGLGYVPLASAPVYSATKAAVHSFTISLRRQLAGSAVRVVEIIPPVVETELHRGQTRKPPRAMRLDAFTSAAFAGLDAGREEIPVGLAKVLRTASRVAPGLFLNIVNKPRG
ncbi:SDR family NAD(P)-dependent oxidoreductase [Blastomonas sp. UPD001]|uniref:SDR family oxidoreductase n=1 Tax=Blastomonas sp. UPD001 TaxID=2217673 RepID=UPI0018E571B5|nr:SDR family NAD(P)-dependent oxidoreductase [Blastomonas sp. UPD001]